MYKRELMEQLRNNELRKEEEKTKRMEERAEGDRLLEEIKDYEEKEKSYHK